MTPEELRLEALRLANGFGEQHDAIVERATAYLAFLTGETALTPRERVTAALDAANVR